MKIKGKNILLGVSGGIAIYKSLELLSRLNKAGARTKVIMTSGAQEFIRPLAFQTMSKNRVYTDLFSQEEGMIPHLDLSREADLFLIAPATANIISKIANGLADDLLSAAALASHCPLMISPAMNTYMYENPATQKNLEILRKRGVLIIEPDSGILACDEVGQGRMPEAKDLLYVIESFFTEKDLKGKKILVSAGPGRERLDPVRFLTNDSSGKQGIALAERALMRGAEVFLVHGKINIPIPKGVNSILAESTEDMLRALEDKFDRADAIIMAAAPADFKPIKEESKKIKGQGQGSSRILELVETPDILQNLSKKKDKQIMIGFATETDNLIENAKRKLTKKNLDYIVLNDVNEEGAAFDGDTNIVTIISKEMEKKYPIMTKSEVADIILDLLK